MTVNIPPRGHYSAPPPSPPLKAHATKSSLLPRGGKTSKLASQKWLSAALRPERSSMKMLLMIQALFMIATLSVVSYVFLGSESEPVLVPNSHTLQGKSGHSIESMYATAEPKADHKTWRPVHTGKAETKLSSDSALIIAKHATVDSKNPGAKPTATKIEPVNVKRELVEGKDGVAHVAHDVSNSDAVTRPAVEPLKVPPLETKVPADVTSSPAKPKLPSKPVLGVVKKEEEKKQTAAVTDATLMASSRKLLRYGGVVEQDRELEDTETQGFASGMSERHGLGNVER